MQGFFVFNNKFIVYRLFLNSKFRFKYSNYFFIPAAEGGGDKNLGIITGYKYSIYSVTILK